MVESTSNIPCKCLNVHQRSIDRIQGSAIIAFGVNKTPKRRRGRRSLTEREKSIRILFRFEHSIPSDLYGRTFVNSAIVLAVVRCVLLSVTGCAYLAQKDHLSQIADFHHHCNPLHAPT
jgi:hypothetical protein